MPSPRLVLCPQGQPQPLRLREAWTRTLQRLGGDLGRILDAPSSTVDRFGQHVARLAVLRSVREPPLVVLTQTNPVAIAVLGARRTLEATVPALAHASWILFLDTVEDPFFLETAARLGELDGTAEAVPIWTGPEQTRFLVVPAGLRDLDLLPHRLLDLTQASLASTGVVDRRTGQLVSSAVASDLLHGAEADIPQLGRRRT